jgi:hypothetical protein
VFALEYQGWPDLEDVPGRAGGAEQYAPIAHGLGHFACGPSRRPARVIGQFDAEQEAFAADVPDQRVPSGEGQQALPEIGTDFRGVGHEALILDDGQHRERGRRGYRVTAEGAEQLDLLGNGPEQLGPDHESGDREAVAHRLAHHHHVGLDP